MLNRGLVGLAGGLFVAVLACSNGTATMDGGATDAGAKCDDTKCKTGNKCIADDKGAMTCRLSCTSNEPSDPGSCPTGFHCVDAQGKANTNTAGASLNYCVKDDKTITPKTSGQWGAPCDARKGFDMNPDCDTAQGFFCYGQSSTDADAFCTLYDCTADTQCRMGYWCATINGTPNVAAPRAFGPDQARSLCLPRAWNLNKLTYSAPCTTDLDCPLNQGLKQHCVDPGDGKHLMCAAECMNNKNCPSDAQCADVGVTVNGNPQNVCVPRAGTFGPLGAMEKGTGDFCSPCHSDADCKTDGLCVTAEKSTEHFCTTKSASACKQGGPFPDCPMKPMSGAAPAGVFCTYTASPSFAPRDQCFGAVNFGAYGVPGCWTAAR